MLRNETAEFEALLNRTGWQRVQNDPPFWRHPARPGRRFDTACATIEALTMRKDAVVFKL